MRPILAIALKDIRLLLRDKAGLFFTLVLPLLFAVFFGVISSGFGGSAQGMKIVVIDEDRTEASKAFVTSLATGPEFDVITSAPDRAAAEDLVRRGKATAFLFLPPGFGEAGRRLFWGEPMTMELGVDPSRKAEAGMIEGLLTARAYSRMQDLFTNPSALNDLSSRAIDAVRADPDVPPAHRLILESFLSSLGSFATNLSSISGDPATGGSAPGFQPVRIERADIVRERMNAYAITFPQGIIWGVMGAAAGFGISFVIERTRGTLVRLRSSPIPSWKILAGKGLACFFTIAAVTTLLLIIARLVFDVRPGSIPLLILAIVCVAVAFVGIMMLLAMFKTEAGAGGGGWAILLVCAMIGGGMMPLAFMPGFMKSLSIISPVRWSIEALEGAIWRSYTPTEMALPCAVLVGVGVLGFAIGARGFRWSAE